MDLSVYPNPASGASGLHVKLQSQGQTWIRLYDGLGRLVRTIQEESFSGGGRTEFHVKTSNLSSGAYYLVGMSGGRQFTKSVIIN